MRATIWNNHDFDPRNYIGEQVVADRLANRIVMVETESLEERRRNIEHRAVWFLTSRIKRS